MVLTFNKDDTNFGTWSERVFAGRDSSSVKLLVHGKIQNKYWDTTYITIFSKLHTTAAVLGKWVLSWSGGE